MGADEKTELKGRGRVSKAPHLAVIAQRLPSAGCSASLSLPQLSLGRASAWRAGSAISRSTRHRHELRLRAERPDLRFVQARPQEEEELYEEVREKHQEQRRGLPGVKESDGAAAGVVEHEADRLALRPKAREDGHHHAEANGEAGVACARAAPRGQRVGRSCAQSCQGGIRHESRWRERRETQKRRMLFVCAICVRWLGRCVQGLTPLSPAPQTIMKHMIFSTAPRSASEV